MSWYKTETGLERLEKEIKLMNHFYPGFIWQLDDDSDCWVVYGKYGKNDSLDKEYEILVEIPTNFNTGGIPYVFILNENLPSDTPHVWHAVDGNYGKPICLLHDRNFFKNNTTIHQLISWAVTWLFCYEQWKKSGKRTYTWSN